ncbi:hypothetical protein Tco_0840907 [Tanacetum coccineum]|uniref:Uncharacterized protein n=1 Tax=Tanacetum coccineum TaxID=301880 RepID=A0ABQ5AUX5_9ASTR
MDDDQAGPDPGVSRVSLAGPNPEPMHEEFMAHVYPDVHESLKFPADEHVILEEPLSSSGALSSMKNLDDAYTIGDQFINDKSTEDESGKLNMESEMKNKNLDKTTRNLGSKVFTLELRDLPYKIDEVVHESVKEAVHIALRAPLRDRFRELPEADMKEILHQRMFEAGTYKSLPEHVALYEALEASMEWENIDEFLPPAPQSSAWETTDAREAPSSLSKQQFGPHAKQPPIPEEDRPETPEPDWPVPLNELPKPENNWANALANSYKDLEENKLLRKTSDMGSFITWFCKRIGKKKLSKSDLEGPAYKVLGYEDRRGAVADINEDGFYQVDLVNPEGHRLVPDVSKPLPLGGPPGQLKAAQYLDFGLEELVSSLWIESEREYDISVAYGISHWWFKCKELYIIKHSAPSDRSIVRSHMRILSVVSLKTYERCGYAFLKEIVLRRADYKEYKISEADLKNLHSNDFEDLYLLHLQGIESYQTKLNLTQPDWDASDFLFKEDYTIVSKPRAVIYIDRNDQKKMIRETEVHKFSDGTLNRILDKLDHMVKDFKLYEYNKGMEIRIWSEDDRRRSNREETQDSKNI